MTMQEKIDKLNEACDNSLTFTRYNDCWKVSSYQDGSPLCMDNCYPFLEGETFEECLDKAYAFVFDKKVEKEIEKAVYSQEDLMKAYKLLMQDSIDREKFAADWCEEIRIEDIKAEAYERGFKDGAAGELHEKITVNSVVEFKGLEDIPEALKTEGKIEVLEEVLGGDDWIDIKVVEKMLDKLKKKTK